MDGLEAVLGNVILSIDLCVSKYNEGRMDLLAQELSSLRNAVVRVRDNEVSE